MTFMVEKKHMNLPNSIAITCFTLLALSGNGLSAIAAETQPANKTFGDWCHQKSNLSAEAKHTVEVLLEKAETTECDAANQKLSTLTQLDLNGNQISDIKPLQSLTNLTHLGLSDNLISDIKPLQSLTKLTNLGLYNNRIGDIQPLQSLTNLTQLGLENNQISDIQPLQSLTNLIFVGLINNEISDIKP